MEPDVGMDGPAIGRGAGSCPAGVVGAARENYSGVRGLVAAGEIQCVEGVVPGRLETARESPRELGVDEELHAAIGTMRCTWLRRAA